MKITLNKATHVYQDETGAIWPGVTSILRDAGVVDATWFTPWHAQRGTAVHAACQMWDEGDLDEVALDPVIEPYLEAWKRFKRDSGFSIGGSGGIELLVWNEAYRYAGTLDRLGWWHDFQWVLDIKSGLSQSWAALQTAAYAKCMGVTCRRGALELHEDATYRLIEHNDRNDFNVFLACLNLRNWKVNNK